MDSDIRDETNDLPMRHLAVDLNRATQACYAQEAGDLDSIWLLPSEVIHELVAFAFPQWPTKAQVKAAHEKLRLL